MDDNNQQVVSRHGISKIYNRSTVSLFTGLIISIPALKRLFEYINYFSRSSRIKEAQCSVGSTIALIVVTFLLILSISYIVGRALQKRYQDRQIHIILFHIYQFVLTGVVLAVVVGIFSLLEAALKASFT